VRPTRDAARLLWFLRATFGVNARADVVANLAARPGSRPTVLELAQLIRFTKRNAAVALDDLVLSGVVERLGPSSVGHFRLRDRPGSSAGSDADSWTIPTGWRCSRSALACPPSWTPSCRAACRPSGARDVTELRPWIERADLPGPDLRVTGPAFAGEFDVGWPAADGLRPGKRA
jgi:hypothetical protein